MGNPFTVHVSEKHDLKIRASIALENAMINELKYHENTN